MSDRTSWAPLVIGTPVAEFEPRPPRSPGYRPDFAADGWSTEHLAVRAASVRGYQHRHDGTPRQDDFALAAHPGSGALVAAVADGVANAELAHLGATLVCRSAVDQLLHALDDDDSDDGDDNNAVPDWPNLMSCAGWALVDFAARQPAADGEADADRAERMLATTLVVALVRPVPGGGATAELARVGDSAAWLLRDDRWHPVFAGDGDELINPVVSALPRVPAELAGSTVELAPGEVLLLGTDGVGLPVGDGSGQVGAAFAEALEHPLAPLELARLLDFSRETFDDDRTLVAVWP